jgi:hypothetical protein
VIPLHTILGWIAADEQDERARTSKDTAIPAPPRAHAPRRARPLYTPPGADRRATKASNIRKLWGY